MIQFKKLINAKALYQEPDRIWVAKGMTFFAVDYSGKRISCVFNVGASCLELDCTIYVQ